MKDLDQTKINSRDQNTKILNRVYNSYPTRANKRKTCRKKLSSKNAFLSLFCGSIFDELGHKPGHED